MAHWTDKHINWNMLSATEIRRLIDTWGKSEEEIAKMDAKAAKKSGKPAPKKAAPKAAPVVETPPVEPKKTVAKKATPAPKTAAPKKTVAKKAATAVEGTRTSTTDKRIRAMAWIPQNGLLNIDRADAIRQVMVEFDVPKNYAADWLKKAAQ